MHITMLDFSVYNKTILEKRPSMHYYVYDTSFWSRSSLALHSEESLLRESRSWSFEGSWVSKDR